MIKLQIAFHIFCRANLLIIVFVAGLVAAHSEDIAVDPNILTHIEETIGTIDEYSGKAGCMAQKIIDENNINNFYAADLLSNHDQLLVELEPYLADARAKCETNFLIYIPKNSMQFVSAGFKKFMSLF